jgi:hypothetical protein
MYRDHYQLSTLNETEKHLLLSDGVKLSDSVIESLEATREEIKNVFAKDEKFQATLKPA